jgi:hypothetical protein
MRYFSTFFAPIQPVRYDAESMEHETYVLKIDLAELFKV